jgi:hypothetical protein
MGSADRIRDLLPSLWRPEPGESGLLSALLDAAGRQLDQARIEAGDTMQAHWIAFADSAILSPYVSALRRRMGKRPLLPDDPEAQLHPYIDDLARLASLLGLVPFTEPLDGRETIEMFRSRVIETMRLCKEGVATRSGVLGSCRLALSGMPERAVQIEEFAPAAPIVEPVATAGAPAGMVGPLMRWQTDSRALLPTPVEIYIEGVATVPAKVDATVNPLIELFDPATGTGTGIAYEGLVEPGRTLALLPTHTSWLGTPAGLRSATALPAAGLPADPAAAGPWSAVAGLPQGSTVRAIAQTSDGSVWAAVTLSAGNGLWRLTPDGWQEAFSDLPEIFCLLAEGDVLHVGHFHGVARLSAFDSEPALKSEPRTATQAAVHALARDGAGTLWAATAMGAARVGPLGGLTFVGPGARKKTETVLNMVQADPDGIVHFGGSDALFRHDPGRDIWHVYVGAEADETVPDWQPWSPAENGIPKDAEVFLPEVTALLRGPDQSLWIGTASGLARYRATRRRGTYATRLEAFPELGTVTVRALAVDERQRLWAGTDRGLLVFDGTHWFQRQSAALVRLSRGDRGDADRAWRFDRRRGTWQSVLAGASGDFKTHQPPLITADGAEPVAAILWTDGAVARIGTLSEDGFSDEAAAPGKLRRRIKPEPTSILEGVLPAMPRLLPGRQNFRYLALEEATPPLPRSFPAWTREGRLLPQPRARAAPAEGRYLLAQALRELETVFAYSPAARVTFRWRPRAALSVTVRLERPVPDESLPPIVPERVFESMKRVRPAGARVRLAHGEALVKGE